MFFFSSAKKDFSNLCKELQRLNGSQTHRLKPPENKIQKKTRSQSIYHQKKESRTCTLSNQQLTRTSRTDITKTSQTPDLKLSFQMLVWFEAWLEKFASGPTNWSQSWSCPYPALLNRHIMRKKRHLGNLFRREASDAFRDRMWVVASLCGRQENLRRAIR